MNGRRDVLRLAASGGLGWVALRFTACGGERGDAPDRVEPADDVRSARPTSGGSPEGDGSPRAADPRAGGTSDASTGARPVDAGDAGDERPARDAAPDVATPDAARATVTLYDTHAQALYYDGSYGPFTGVVRVAYVIANASVTLDFWHGHGGEVHRWTLTPAHFAELKRLRRVTIETSMVEGHTHTLFVDPLDPRWRVPGAPPVAVPL